MKHLWQRIVHKIARKLGLYGTLKSEQALRAKNIEILYLKREVEQLEQKVGFAQRALEETTVKRAAIVYIDSSKQAAYEQQSPVTDPALLSRIQERKRQEALQAEIRKEQARREKMKTFVAEITGQPNIRTSELPSMTGDLRRQWQTGKLNKLDPDGLLL